MATTSPSWGEGAHPHSRYKRRERMKKYCSRDIQYNLTVHCLYFIWYSHLIAFFIISFSLFLDALSCRPSSWPGSAVQCSRRRSTRREQEIYLKNTNEFTRNKWLKKLSVLMIFCLLLSRGVRLMAMILSFVMNHDSPSVIYFTKGMRKDGVGVGL